MFNVNPSKVRSLTGNLKLVQKSLDKVINLPYLSSFWENHKALRQQYESFCLQIETRKNIAIIFLQFLDHFRNQLEEVIPLS
jgi:hypothetical protein